MNSLVLTRWRPDKPNGGAALRNWQNIRGLACLGPVDVVSVGAEDMSAPVDGVREWTPFSVRHRSRWDRLKTTLWLVRPGVYSSIDAFHIGDVGSWLAGRVRDRSYDVAVVEGIGLASYLPDLKRARCRVVLDAHNVESVLHQTVASANAVNATFTRRLKDAVLQRRITQAEKRAVLGADVVWACSSVDAIAIERIYGTSVRPVVVPNGVDVEAYRRSGASKAGDDWSQLPITLLYPGQFGYQPNEAAALQLTTQVLPSIRARGHHARAVLVGRDPTAAMAKAARQVGGVELTGAVESVLPYLEQPCVITLPITLGSGTRLKIVEAFAAGRPVVSTAKGAEGIEAEDGKHLLLREEPEAIADAVIALWNDRALRASLVDHALALVQSGYSWSVAAHRIAQSLGTPAGHAGAGVGVPAASLRSV